MKHAIDLINLTRGPLVWEVLTLQDLLPYLCQSCPNFSQLLENNRKSVVWYCPFLEFCSRLCYQELWFCLATIEASTVKNVPGQLAALTRLLVRDMCCGDRAANTAGIILPVGVGGRHELVRLIYHATLADEEALSAMNGLKGSGGVAPCAMRCWCVGKEKQSDADRKLAAPLGRSQVTPP